MAETNILEILKEWCVDEIIKANWIEIKTPLELLKNLQAKNGINLMSILNYFMSIISKYINVRINI